MKKYSIADARKLVKVKDRRTGKMKEASQLDMALILDISPASWNYKENYQKQLKAKELITLANKAGIDPRQIKLEL